MKPKERERLRRPRNDIISESDLSAAEHEEYMNLAYAAGPLEDDYSEESEP